MRRIILITTRPARCCAAILLWACDSATAPRPAPEDVQALVVEAVTPTSLAGVVAAEIAPAPIVRVRYEDGTAARGVAVLFTASDGGAPGNDSAVTDSSGHASPGAWRLGTKSGIQTLTARSGHGTLTFTAHARPGPATVLTVHGGNAQSATAGATLPQPLRARALDGFGNPVPGTAVTFVVIQGGGAIPADTVYTDDDGGATSGPWTLGPIAGEQQVRALSGAAQVVFTAGACSPESCRQFAFVSNSQIFVLDEHSGLIGQLTSTARDAQPTWSPDGSRVAFARYSTDWMSADVWVMNADGSGQARVTSGKVSHSPTWSPGGNALAFAGDWGACVYECAIYVQELAEGSVPRLIAPMGADPAWSPDGSHIAFVALSGDDGYHSLRLVRPDGSGIVEVTPIDEGSINRPAWSPDGTLIAFSKCVAGSCDIYTVRPDGSQLAQVTYVGNASRPAWSADAKRIAFTRWSGGNPSIAWVPAAGGAATPLVAKGHSPAWRPR
jgi:Tol biopolymer transport system component